MEISVESNSPEQTESLAIILGGNLKGGEVIELISDIGGGKTTFTRGLAQAISSGNKVASPTFTISRVYNGKGIDIHHFDFYRLKNIGIMQYELADIMLDSKNVVVIEWAELVESVLPKEKLKIRFEYLGEDSRKLVFTYPESLSYLTKGLC